MEKKFIDINSYFVNDSIRTENALLLLLHRNVNISSALVKHYTSLSMAFPEIRKALILYGHTLKKYLINKKLNKPSEALRLHLDTMADDIFDLDCASGTFFIESYDYFKAMELFPFSIKFDSHNDEDSLLELFSTYGADDIIPHDFEVDTTELSDLDMDNLISSYTYYTFKLESSSIDLYLDKYFDNEEKKAELISFIEPFYNFISPTMYHHSKTLIRRRKGEDNSNRYCLHFATTEPYEPESNALEFSDYNKLLDTLSQFNAFLLDNI